MNNDYGFPEKKNRLGVQTIGREDRLPPHSLEAEQGVLGCCVLDQSGGCVKQCQDWFKGEMPFFDLRHAELFWTMETLWREGEPIDLIVLQDALKSANKLDQVGGLAYLAHLPDMVPSAANVEYYLKIVWEKFLARQLLQSNREISDAVMESDGVDEQLIARYKRLQEEFDHKSQQGDITPKYLKRPADFQDGFFAQFFGGKKEVPGCELPIPFPLKIRRKEATLLSGDDGSGKSTLLNYFGLHLAAQGEKIMIASMEMPPAVTLWVLACQLMGTKHLPDTGAGRQRAVDAFAWLNERFILYDFTGIADWRDVLDSFRYAAEYQGMTAAILDSVMRIGIPDDDYAQQAVAAARFGQFTMDHDCHLFYVIHENKGDANGKNKVRGSKLWTANANNVLTVKINHDKGIKRDKLLWAMSQEKQRHHPSQDEIDRIQKEVDDMRFDWDTELILRKQRWPGTQQNGSKRFYFDNENFQFRAHQQDAPVAWLDRWRRKPALPGAVIDV